jgi:NAD-dependent SIR2 family protein deacetylase
MARTVFILGAGVSAGAGAPLMNQFLRAMRDLYEAGPSSEYDDDFELVLRAHSLLQAAYAKMRMNYENDIEELFATFEMIRILDGDSDELSDLEPERLTLAMRRAIGATIERRMLFSAYTRSGVGPTHQPHPYLLDFIHFLQDFIRSGRPDSSIAVLSFNYDLAFDYALEHSGTPFDYRLDTDSGRAGIPFLKLHGSLNWAVCPKCGQVVPYHIADYQEAHPLPEETQSPILLSAHLSDVTHCGASLPAQPFLVPPTWNKTEYQRAVAQVWRAAYSELSEASNIIVCGYSFPPTDQFFRHLLAIALSGGVIVDSLVVANPDRAAFDRFSSMLSEGTRSVLVHSPSRFEDSAQWFRSFFKVQTQPWQGNWTTPWPFRT